MIITNQTQPKAKPDLVNYLTQKIGLNIKALELGMRQADLEQAPLPIVLWSFGLLSLKQYLNVIDWEKDNL